MNSADRDALAGDAVTAQITRAGQALGVEWGALSGDLVNAPVPDIGQAATNGTAANGNQQTVTHNTGSGGSPRTTGAVPLSRKATVFRVPVEVLDRVIDTGYHSTYADDGDSGPGPFDPRFGLSDALERQLGADQIPAFGDLYLPRTRQRDLHQTQVFPAITDGRPDVPRPAEQELTQRLPVITDSVPPAATEVTQRIPVVRAPGWPLPRATPYHPLAGDLPVGGAPTMPGVPMRSSNLSFLPDLPPVPTLPTMPPLPNRRLPGRPPPRPGMQGWPVGPSLFTPNVPVAAEHTGSAEQLMSQLRGLISELEHGDTPHPSYLTEPQEPLDF